MGQYAPPPGPWPGPPHVDNSLLRPRKRGYWIGIAGGVFGLIVAVTMIVIAVQAFPTPKAVASGQSKTVEVDDDGLGIYSDGFSELRCTARGPGGKDVALKELGHSESVEINGRSWQLVLRGEDGLPSGEYQVRCVVADGSEYGVGPRGGVFTFIGLLFGGIAVAGLSVLGAGLTALIVFLRRRSHRERLRAQAAWGGGAPGAGPPGYWAP